MTRLLLLVLLSLYSMRSFAQQDTTFVYYQQLDVNDGDTTERLDALDMNELCLVGDSLFYLFARDTVLVEKGIPVNDTSVVTQTQAKTNVAWRYLASYTVENGQVLQGALAHGKSNLARNRPAVLFRFNAIGDSATDISIYQMMLGVPPNVYEGEDVYVLHGVSYPVLKFRMIYRHYNSRGGDEQMTTGYILADKRTMLLLYIEYHYSSSSSVFIKTCYKIERR